VEFDSGELDTSISKEQLADYWRERAECLEEWVCELLRKNQALRMDLQKISHNTSSEQLMKIVT
jgi:hypothetical protein